jgi:hypothetical protein
LTIHLPTEIRENIAIINGVPWGFGKMPSYTLSGLSNEEKRQYIRQSESFFRDVVEPDMTGCIWLLKKEYSWNEELKKVINTAPIENRKELKKLKEAWLQEIETQDGQSQYFYLFGMELSIHNSFRQQVARYNPFTHPQVQRLLRKWTSTSLSDQNLQRFQQQFREKTARFGIEPCTPQEIMNLYQQHNHCGFSQPSLGQLKYLFPNNHHFLMPNPIENRGRYLRIEHVEGIRYITFLTVSLYPSQIPVPGFDLLYDIQSLGLPVEVQLWWRQKGYRDARMYSERKKKLAISNRQHMADIAQDSMSDESIEERAEQMEYEIYEQASPLNMVQLVFCLSTQYGVEELDYYVKLLEHYLEQKGVVPYRSTADQAEYYDSWLPTSHWTPVGYRFPMLPDRTAALSLPGATDSLGDPSGLPKGFLMTNGSVFRLNFSWGAQVDQASNIVIVGQTGSGKTHLADDIVRDTLLTTHSRGIYIDVKNEHENWKEVPGLKGQVQVKRLDGYQHPGMLDPFHLIQRIDSDEEFEGDSENHQLAKARELAYDLILTILDMGQDPHLFARRNEILSALDRVCKKPHPCMRKVIEELEQSEEPSMKDMGKYLRRIATLPLGQLLFGESKDETRIAFPKSGLIVLGIKNLRLPDRGERASNPTEKISEALMMSLSTLVEQFLIEGKEQGTFSFFVGDEGYAYMSSMAGSRQIERNFRLGRSAFCGNIICTQNPEDIPDSLLNHVSTYICLGTKTDRQTIKAMEALGVSEENEEVFHELKQLGIEQSQKSQKEALQDREASYGYVRDLQQQVGLVRFVTPQAHVRKFLKTRPELVINNKEENGGES